MAAVTPQTDFQKKQALIAGLYNTPQTPKPSNHKEEHKVDAIAQEAFTETADQLQPLRDSQTKKAKRIKSQQTAPTKKETLQNFTDSSLSIPETSPTPDALSLSFFQKSEDPKYETIFSANGSLVHNDTKIGSFQTSETNHPEKGTDLQALCLFVTIGVIVAAALYPRKAS